MRYWLALGSNENPHQALDLACGALAKLGTLKESSRYCTEPRAGVGVCFENMAVELATGLSKDGLIEQICALEALAGRVRGSDVVRLDIDLIAWQADAAPVLVKHRLPWPLDVVLPMQEIWPEGIQLAQNRSF